MEVPKIIRDIDEVNEILQTAKKYQDSLIDTFMDGALVSLPYEAMDLSVVQQSRFFYHSFNELQHTFGARALLLSSRSQPSFGVYPSYDMNHERAHYEEVRYIPEFFWPEMGSEITCPVGEVPELYDFGVVNNDYIAKVSTNWWPRKEDWAERSDPFLSRSIVLTIQRRN